jgi:hypothetical protein
MNSRNLMVAHTHKQGLNSKGHHPEAGVLFCLQIRGCVNSVYVSETASRFILFTAELPFIKPERIITHKVW